MNISYKNPNGFDTSLFGCIEEGEEKAKEFYLKWVEEVKQSAPPEKLLVHEAKDGWEPLCKFLNVPVPKIPYPKTNDTAKIRCEIRKFVLTSFIMVFSIVFAVIGIIIYLVHYALAIQ